MGLIPPKTAPSNAPQNGKDRDGKDKGREEAARAAALPLQLRAEARHAANVAAKAMEKFTALQERFNVLAGRNAYLRICSALAATSVEPRAHGVLLTEVLDAAITLTRADMGNIQLLGPESGALEIAAQREFKPFFLDYFAAVRDGSTACGAALANGARVIVEDVAVSPIFAGTRGRQVMLAASANAVQSTPIVTSSGRVLGVLSTHYRHPRRPDEACLSLLDALALRTADVLERANGHFNGSRNPSAVSGPSLDGRTFYCVQSKIVYG